MSSNNLPKGIVTASGVHSTTNVNNEQPYMAFDNNQNTYWESQFKSNNPDMWIKYAFGEPVILKKVKIIPYANRETIYNLSVSIDNGLTYQIVKSVSVTTLDAKEIELESPIYNVTHIMLTDVNGNYLYADGYVVCMIRELQAYGYIND